MALVCSVVAGLLRSRGSALLQRFEQAVVNSYIEDNSHVRWCPSVPCCGRAVEALDDVHCEVRCDCGQHFSFKCGGPAHSPCTCSMWREWVLKQSDDSETQHYIQANTKPCPKCGVPVDKDGGCNLVVCRSCRQPFCWLCGAKTGTSHTWTQIEGHTCGEWKKTREERANDSKAKLERYLHYHSHFQGHLESAKKEDFTLKLNKLIPRLREQISEGVDWSYLMHASNALLECRRILSNMYAFAYFMFNASDFCQDMLPLENHRLQLLFEDGMSTLTLAVEQLSSALAEDEAALGHVVAVKKRKNVQVDASRGVDETRRQRIINLSVNIDKRIHNLFHLIEKDILTAVTTQNIQIASYKPLYSIHL